MNDLVLAIGMSPRDWPGRLHRFVADHGGARIRITALTEQDLDGEFDVLVLDDLCPLLSPRLVEQLEREGRVVLGLVDPEHREEGRRILRRCGVEVILDTEASFDELLGVAALAAGAADGFFDAPDPSTAFRVGVTGADGSCGKTEVAIGLARAFTTMCGPTALLDFDLERSSVAMRLGLRPHPNLRNALLALREGRFGDGGMFQRARRVDVLPGLYGGEDQPPPSIRDLSELLRTLRTPVVVADLGSSRGMLGAFDAVVAVGRADPVGIARLLIWLSDAAVPAERLHVMFNRAPREPFARAEMQRELRTVADPSSITFLPVDAAVSDAAWESAMCAGGRFQRTLSRWVSDVAGRADVGVR